MMRSRILFPPTIRTVALCSTPGCPRPKRTGGRTCPPCNALAFSRWYLGHHTEALQARRQARAERTAEQCARDSARAKLAMAIRRGKIIRNACARCNVAKVTAYIPDPANWRAFLWLCRAHRAEEIARRNTPTPEQTAAAWAAKREAVLAAVAALPETQRARLHAIAARGPAGLRVSPEAPFYTIRLIQAYEAEIATSPDITTSAEPDPHHNTASNPECAAR